MLSRLMHQHLNIEGADIAVALNSCAATGLNDGVIDMPRCCRDSSGGFWKLPIITSAMMVPALLQNFRTTRVCKILMSFTCHVNTEHARPNHASIPLKCVRQGNTRQPWWPAFPKDNTLWCPKAIRFLRVAFYTVLWRRTGKPLKVALKVAKREREKKKKADEKEMEEEKREHE